MGIAFTTSRRDAGLERAGETAPTPIPALSSGMAPMRRKGPPGQSGRGRRCRAGSAVAFAAGATVWAEHAVQPAGDDAVAGAQGDAAAGSWIGNRQFGVGFQIHRLGGRRRCGKGKLCSTRSAEKRGRPAPSSHRGSARWCPWLAHVRHQWLHSCAGRTPQAARPGPPFSGPGEAFARFSRADARMNNSEAAGPAGSQPWSVSERPIQQRGCGRRARTSSAMVLGFELKNGATTSRRWPRLRPARSCRRGGGS